ncbi:hypothetical protein CPB83DRAFT_850068 [Crepidotus variabilis]|uniref:Uncharacterized protein n=1 Tax=Crepidotus variabilis TaxID=179855 RepID=A0A9P6EJ63_9AGAR|nr:hypothetical protein CPB83DRAFT_850068 [Crepidotus variabilis]
MTLLESAITSPSVVNFIYYYILTVNHSALYIFQYQAQIVYLSVSGSDCDTKVASYFLWLLFL